MSLQPDMTKVAAAVKKYAPKRINTVSESNPPIDSSIRKPLKAHGKICTGFNHPHFLNVGQQ